MKAHELLGLTDLEKMELRGALMREGKRLARLNTGSRTIRDRALLRETLLRLMRAVGAEVKP